MWRGLSRLAAASGLLLLCGLTAGALRGYAQTDPIPKPIQVQGDEVPPEMVEFLLMMDMVEKYGEVIDVEIEILDKDQDITEPLDE